MRFVLSIIFIFFCHNSFANIFTLTGATEQQSSVFLNKKTHKNSLGGYSVYCNFSVMPTSANIKIFLGNRPADLTEASNLVVTTTGVHGIDVTTYSNVARISIAPTGGSFTAVCTDNQ